VMVGCNLLSVRHMWTPGEGGGEGALGPADTNHLFTSNMDSNTISYQAIYFSNRQIGKRPDENNSLPFILSGFVLIYGPGAHFVSP
jgi:hypothetical protein